MRQTRNNYKICCLFINLHLYCVTLRYILLYYIIDCIVLHYIIHNYGNGKRCFGVARVMAITELLAITIMAIVGVSVSIYVKYSNIWPWSALRAFILGALLCASPMGNGSNHKLYCYHTCRCHSRDQFLIPYKTLALVLSNLVVLQPLTHTSQLSFLWRLDSSSTPVFNTDTIKCSLSLEFQDSTGADRDKFCTYSSDLSVDIIKVLAVFVSVDCIAIYLHYHSIILNMLCFTLYRAFTIYIIRYSAAFVQFSAALRYLKNCDNH